MGIIRGYDVKCDSCKRKHSVSEDYPYENESEARDFATVDGWIEYKVRSGGTRWACDRCQGAKTASEGE